MKTIYGPITVDETEFQELFNLYWNTWEGSKERLYVINEVNKYFYCYIVYRYPSEFDLASEFFLENIQKTKKLVEDYDPSYHITFLAYLKSKIKRKYLNFKLKFHKAKILENLNEFYQVNPNLYIRSVFEPVAECELEFKRYLNQQLNKCFCHLSQDEEIAVKLYFCFNLGYKEFRFLRRKFGSNEFFRHYRIYLNHVNDRLSKEQNIRKKIVDKLYTTNILLQESHESRIERKKHKLIKNYNSIKKPVPLRMIAEILQTNITNIHRKIKRGSLKIQKFLIESQLHIPEPQREIHAKRINKAA